MPTTGRIYYALHDGGQKDLPPVILLHGAGSSHIVWPSALRRLSGQRVYAIDLPGHGRTQGVVLQSIPACADQVIEFMADLGLYQAVFVGHSMGGAIALDLAVRHPDHVAGLGLIATGAYLGIPQDMLESFSNPFTLTNALHLFSQRAFSAASSPVLVERCLAGMKEVRPSVIAADWQACAEFDLRSTINQINAPAWVIVGAEDQLTPVAFAHFLSNHLPAARLQIIPSAGHMVILEQPERVAQSLQQLLTVVANSRFAAAPRKMP